MPVVVQNLLECGVVSDRGSLAEVSRKEFGLVDGTARQPACCYTRGPLCFSD